MTLAVTISLKIVFFFIFLLLLGLQFHTYKIAYYCPRDQKVSTDFFPLSFQPATYFRYCVVSISLLRSVTCSFIIVIFSFYSLNRPTVTISKSLLIETLLSSLNCFYWLPHFCLWIIFSCFLSHPTVLIMWENIWEISGFWCLPLMGADFCFCRCLTDWPLGLMLLQLVCKTC